MKHKKALFHGDRVSTWGDEKGLEVAGVTVAQECERTQCRRTSHLKRVRVMNFILHIFFHNKNIEKLINKYVNNTMNIKTLALFLPQRSCSIKGSSKKLIIIIGEIKKDYSTIPDSLSKHLLSVRCMPDAGEILENKTDKKCCLPGPYILAGETEDK